MAISMNGRRAMTVQAKAQRPAAVGAKKAAKKAAVLGSAAVYAAPALAETTAPVKVDAVDSTIDQLVALVKASGELVRQGSAAVESGVKVAQEGYIVAAPYLEKGYKAAAPVAEKVFKAGSGLATEALKAGTPVINEATKVVDSTLSEPTVSTVVKTTTQAATAASPVVNQLINTIITSDATTLAKYGLGAIALVYLGPPTLGLLGGSLRGYAGDITAASVLDAMNDGSCTLIDIRSQAEKEKSGVPDVPSSMSRRFVEVEFATTGDKKLRNALRNPGYIEACVTSLQISSLKGINKGTKVILLDSRGGTSKQVAKELTAKGFGKVFVVSGGFDGSGGWVQSKLQIKPTLLKADSGILGGTFRSSSMKSLPSPKSA